MRGEGIIAEAASGRLPEWAELGPARRAHAARLAELLDEWAARLGLPEGERVRWRAAGWLHDALKSADPEELRQRVGPEFRDFPAPTLHGPGAAARLAADGVDDAGLLRAIAYHTIGHPELDLLGRALYLADYVEPGRDEEDPSRAALRARLPDAMDEILPQVIADRIRYSLARRRPLRAETVAFWNTVVGETPRSRP